MEHSSKSKKYGTVLHEKFFSPALGVEKHYHIDAAYRTIPERTHRGMDGFSLGGFCSVMLAVKHPELFSTVGSYDGSFMFRTLKNERHRPGRHSVEWNGQNAAGHIFVSGLYLVQFSIPGGSIRQKFVLLR